MAMRIAGAPMDAQGNRSLKMSSASRSEMPHPNLESVSSNSHCEFQIHSKPEQISVAIVAGLVGHPAAIRHQFTSRLADNSPSLFPSPPMNNNNVWSGRVSWPLALEACVHVAQLRSWLYLKCLCSIRLCDRLVSLTAGFCDAGPV
jgi:hypothetical protein